MVYRWASHTDFTGLVCGYDHDPKVTVSTALSGSDVSHGGYGQHYIGTLTQETATSNSDDARETGQDRQHTSFKHGILSQSPSETKPHSSGVASAAGDLKPHTHLCPGDHDVTFLDKPILFSLTLGSPLLSPGVSANHLYFPGLAFPR